MKTKVDINNTNTYKGFVYSSSRDKYILTCYKNI